MNNVRRRQGAANLMLVWLLLSAIVLGALVALLVWKPSLEREKAAADELFVYCAAGMRYPMDAIAKKYEDEYGVHINLQYGGSNTLLSQLQVAHSGDLYLAADDSYIKLARQRDLATEVIPLCTMRPVIIVDKSSDAQISSIDDLIQGKFTIACGNPGAAAIGRTVRQLLTKSGHWKQLEELVTDRGVFKPTVNDVANDVKLETVDAGIVWDCTAAQYPELKVIHVPELQGGVSAVSITVLNSTNDPTAALRFARYAGASDQGLAVFKEMHFPVVQGDEWALEPDLTFFAGSVNRRALDPIIKKFQQREGASVNTIYNGCGILTGQMKAIVQNQSSGFPDTYMACDVYYMNTVKEWFEDRVAVSDTDIVIAVPKGNPKNIKSLQDLLKPGMRVVIGQPDQCTIGVLTQRLLKDVGIYDELMKTNVVSQTASSALLVPAVTTNSADAVLAYRTDTLAEQDKVDVISIEGALAKAIQPFGVAKTSKHKQLARRLFDTIRRSRDAFESVGFRWRLDSEPEEDAATGDAGTSPPDNPATKQPPAKQPAAGAKAAREGPAKTKTDTPAPAQPPTKEPAKKESAKKEPAKKEPAKADTPPADAPPTAAVKTGQTTAEKKTEPPADKTDKTESAPTGKDGPKQQPTGAKKQ